VDTGFNMPESREAITGGLAEIGVEMNDTDIMLTHLHSDHTGLAPSISGPDSKLFMSGIDLKIFKLFNDPGYLEELDSIFLSFGLSEQELLKNKRLNPAMIYLPEKDAEYTSIDDGHVFDLGTCRLECIMTPGHTPGHICLYDRENKLFFSGDHILFGISPNITSWITLPDSLGSYLESLKKVRDLEIERTFSSHRQVEGDIKKRIDELISHHGERLDEAEQSVRKRGTATVYETASDLTWSIRAKNWDEFPVAQKWFALGETHSHLENLKMKKILNSTIKNGLISYSIA